MRLITPLARALAATRITPNGVTSLGFVVVAAGCYLVAGGELFIAGFVIGIGGVFDSFDGLVAKITGKASKRGAFLDSTLDRLSDALLFLAAAWYFIVLPVPGLFEPPSPYTFNGYHVALAVGCLILALMTSYIRAKAESLGYDGSAGFIERAERMIIYVLGLLLGYFVEALAILFVLSAITVVQRFVSVWRQGKPKG
jgi:CDP-diacylglycerol--glycerol-3-phosphate 3-phosphatidyltransferase